MRTGYSVVVMKNGDPILTIGPCLCGLSEFTDEDQRAIREAGEHLISFMGPSNPPCFLCGGVTECKADCPLVPLSEAQD